MLTPKQRLLAVLDKRPTDRPPVICTGGMMNAAIAEIMESSGCKLPAAHADSSLMAELAALIQRQTGFENLGMPFCMTVEAELLGSDVSYGTLECEPKVERELYSSLFDVEKKDIDDMMRAGRAGVVLEAIRLSSAASPTLPVIGNICGPISLAASLVDPVTFLKGLRKEKESAHSLLSYVSELLARLACEMATAGADVIAIGDPTATGEILGPQLFAEFAGPYINQIIDRIHTGGTKVILHICGNMNRVRDQLPGLRSDAISVDALISLAKLKEDFPDLVTMGNISTYLLQNGPEETIRQTARRLAAEGVDIIAPACGLSTATSLKLIRAMTDTVAAAVRMEGEK